MKNQLFILIGYFISYILFLYALNAETFKIVEYYPNRAIYRQRAFHSKDIDAKLLTPTYLNYAFVKVDVQGNLILFDSWADTSCCTD